MGTTANSYGILCALGAALFFGASTPLAKPLTQQVHPVLLAGILYLGSGIGLGIWLALQRGNNHEAPLQKHDIPWIGGAILFGGIVGPVLLLTGLAVTPASTASLLLNMEGVLTALVAWIIFREHFHRRIGLGMLLITAGGVVLSWIGLPGQISAAGPLLIAAACLCWAFDNNLTRKISAANPVQIAFVKGLVAGIVNIALGIAMGANLPGVKVTILAGIIGFWGYGVSLVLFVLGLRYIGTSRAIAYFSLSPFAGAFLSFVFLQEMLTLGFVAAAVLMAWGVWLHVTEQHDHEHYHESIRHSHRHVHNDAHHDHEHTFPWDPAKPHSHAHIHTQVLHSHPHFPDIHHRHHH